jgi:prepilin-type N-terminal cleavage/methylation domain-containing protein
MAINKGFTLLELMIVIAIIGLISAVIAPKFQGKTPRYERELFIARFNTLVQYGWQQALITHKIHRINIDVGKKLITLTVQSEEKDKTGESGYKPLVNPVQETECIIPDQIIIKQFFIEGSDMMAKFSRSKTASVWFYIIPEGMVQNVVVNFNDTKDLLNNQARPVGLVLNPFSAQFKVYDAFQKP